MILLNKYINGRVPYVQEIKNIFFMWTNFKVFIEFVSSKSKCWNNLIEVILTTDFFHEDTLKSQDF